MSIIFGLFSIIFLFVILVAVVLFIVFMARKTGILSTSTEISTGDEQEQGNSKSTLKSYLKDFNVLSQSLVFRFILISILIGLMTIPQNMVSDIIHERSRLHTNVVADIANTWGHRQKITGPALVVPYTEKYISVKVLTDKDGNERKVNQTSYHNYNAIVLPDTLNIDSNLAGQKRKRSLYESLVYRADMSLKGSFKRPDIAGLSDKIDTIHWDRAWFVLGISDTQAINQVSRLKWNDESADFEPGTRITETLKSGFHAPLQLDTSGNHYAFSLTLNVNGSQGFFFSPFGKTTDVKVVSDWPHPSFQGNVLPDHHNVSEQGFTATWSVPHLARNYPQLWTLEKHNFDVHEFSAGVNMFESVTLYTQIIRAIKYGVLFLSLTYITFLIFELGIGSRLHIVQYAVIGLALTLFYLTLLSMAEHSNFFTAYVSAAAVITTMISLYAFAAIRSLSRTAIITLLLVGLYSMLYSLLKLEDYALLVGTGLLLAILAILMYLTRNIGRKKPAITH